MPATARRRSTSCATPRTRSWRICSAANVRRPWPWCFPTCRPSGQASLGASGRRPLQIEVVRRLVDLDNTDPETLGEVEQALEARLSQQFAVERRRAAGPEAVARILAACDPAARGRILDNLAAHDQPLAEQFGDRPIAFDDLAQFDDAVLLAVFRAAEPEVRPGGVLGSAAGAGRTAVAPHVARKRRNVCVSKLDHPGPIRLSDVEEARRQIAALAQQISRDRPRKAA